MRTSLGIFFFCLGGLLEIFVFKDTPTGSPAGITAMEAEAAPADVEASGGKLVADLVKPVGASEAVHSASPESPAADSPLQEAEPVQTSPPGAQTQAADPGQGERSEELSETEWANLLQRVAEQEEQAARDAAAGTGQGADELGRATEAGAAQEEVFDPTLPDETARVRIALLLDGPWHRDEEALYELENQILLRVGSEYGVRFPARLQRDGGWSKTGVEAALEELLADDTVDMIVAFGPLASNAALRRAQAFEKPVLAPIVLAPYFQRAPLHAGTSGRENLAYLGAPRDLVRDLRTLREVAPFERIGFMLPQNIVEAVPTLFPAFAAAARELDVQFKFYPLRATAEETLASLDGDLDAIYVGPLSELPNDEFEALVAGFRERRLPSFSYWGFSEVSRGLMVGRRGEQDRSGLYARIADQVEALLAGQPASDLPVLFEVGDKLSINMSTARAIGIWPDWAVLTGAELLEEAPEVDARHWSLAQAMRWAALANRDVLTSSSRIAASEQDTYGARAELYPRVTVAAKGVVLEDEGTNFRAQRQLLGFLRVRQVLYDERLLADYDIEKWLQESREFEHEALVLDVQFLAAQAYLDLLRAKTIERVQKEDLDLSRSNLELVDLRRRNGGSADSDGYRWQNRVAVVRRAALDARASVRQAELELNRILHRPLEEPLLTAEMGVDDPGILMAGTRLRGFLQNPWSFGTLADFSVQEGLANAPELRAIEASISAASRDVDANRRAYWMPRLTLDGDVTERIGFARNTPLDTDNNTNWTVALNASFDVYNGGAKAAGLRQARHELLAMRSLHDATAERVEESVRSRMYSVTASYPGIELAHQAADAARRNLALVRDLYAQGTASIVDMLDAQGAMVEAEEMAANAVYEFLLDLMSVQRAVGRYDYFMSSSEREGWFARLERFGP